MGDFKGFTWRPILFVISLMATTTSSLSNRLESDEGLYWSSRKQYSEASYIKSSEYQEKGDVEICITIRTFDETESDLLICDIVRRSESYLAAGEEWNDAAQNWLSSAIYNFNRQVFHIKDRTRQNSQQNSRGGLRSNNQSQENFLRGRTLSSSSSQRFLRYHDDDFHYEQTEKCNRFEEYYASTAEDIIRNAIGTLFCTICAAMAAGLTMGMVSIEPLQLLIKMRVGTSQEKEHAQAILPLVRQHHRLLVSLLLVNSLANEALPLFLEKIVPEYVAVLLSVTLVLVFGEIVPAAIFTGPNQISIAASCAPMVNKLMFVLSPIAVPIAKLLDYFLGHGGDPAHSASDEYYNRGEIGAMVRVIYEEQNRPKHEMMQSKMLAAVNTLSTTPSRGIDNSASSRNLHLDEVTMIEGALTMKTKKARDVYKPLSTVFAVDESIVLDEDTIASLYNSGHSRIPVYESDGLSQDQAKRRIKAVLLTRNLIVVDWDLKRSVKSLPLLRPHCVPPNMSLVDLINDFQKFGTHFGMAGHLAIVCENAELANDCLKRKEAIPIEANVLGIVTLEDVIEELLQKNVVDESDKLEVKKMQSARRAVTKWRSFVDQRRAKRLEEEKRQKRKKELELLQRRERSSFHPEYCADTACSHDSAYHLWAAEDSF